MQKQIQVLKTKKERGEFLENDFLDRLIRIEQRVSAKFGSLIKYTDTYCYKNLTPENRERYEEYLKTKKKKKFAFAATFMIPLLGILFLSNGITGNVVKEGVGEIGFHMFYWILLIFLIAGILGLGVFYLIRLNREKRFGPLFKPLENIGKTKCL
jgi:Zn-finger nucleic acid-binding protein